MTTRGINNGSPHYGIRSIRSENFKFIWNLTPEAKFVNACVKSPEFQSWKTVNTPEAKALVKRYQHRPKEEFYDIVNDPLELNNLADDPHYHDQIATLRAKLKAWMHECGDEGQTTELKALERMGKNRKKKKPKK